MKRKLKEFLTRPFEGLVLPDRWLREDEILALAHRAGLPVAAVNEAALALRFNEACTEAALHACKASGEEYAAWAAGFLDTVAEAAAALLAAIGDGRTRGAAQTSAGILLDLLAADQEGALVRTKGGTQPRTGEPVPPVRLATWRSVFHLEREAKAAAKHWRAKAPAPARGRPATASPRALLIKGLDAACIKTWPGAPRRAVAAFMKSACAAIRKRHPELRQPLQVLFSVTEEDLRRPRGRPRRRPSVRANGQK